MYCIGVRAALCRALFANSLSPHGEVLAVHGAGHAFSDRRTASLVPHTMVSTATLW